MTWRTYFEMSEVAVNLEEILRPNLKEYYGGMKSTANTDVVNKIINLDVSQSPLKTALSYAYELKNLDNVEQYEEINNNAKKHLITKSEYVKSTIKLEAEAIFFRCHVFHGFEIKENDLSFKKDYLEIYDATKELLMEERIKKISLYIQENGIVRREYSAKKYYAACYDFYAGKRGWPSFYEEQPSKEKIIFTLEDINSTPKI